MKKYKNDYVWNDRMCHHLPYEMMVEVIDLYRDCFDYSAYREYDYIMAFVTKCFITRNKQLDHQRTIAQVKMKFGFLTIYYDGGRDPYLDEIVNTAAKMAKQIKAKMHKQYGKGDLGIEKYFSQLKVSKLPNGKVPKYKVGDLVNIRFTSDYCPTSSYVLKDGIGLITEVIFYMCTDYDEKSKHENPTYVIEYKLIPAHRDSEIRYVSEQYLELLEKEND